jgi:hypothetical protein
MLEWVRSFSEDSSADERCKWMNRWKHDPMNNPTTRLNTCSNSKGRFCRMNKGSMTESIGPERIIKTFSSPFIHNRNYDDGGCYDSRFVRLFQQPIRSSLHFWVGRLHSCEMNDHKSRQVISNQIATQPPSESLSSLGNSTQMSKAFVTQCQKTFCLSMTNKVNGQIIGGV